jgi:hypothetical protein
MTACHPRPASAVMPGAAKPLTVETLRGVDPEMVEGLRGSRDRTLFCQKQGEKIPMGGMAEEGA